MDDHVRVYVTSYSEEVTGSNTHVNILFPNGRTVAFLVDCGLFQEKQYVELNYEKFKYSPSNINFAIATHVHTDHVGRFPYLVREGFFGNIYTSYETKVVMPTILKETCERLKEEFESDFKKFNDHKRTIRKFKLDAKGRGKKDKQRSEKIKLKNKNIKVTKPTLIFESDDIGHCMKHVLNKKLYEPFSPCDGIEITFFPNAHIGGAVLVFCRIFDEKDEITLLFTGDIGMKNTVTNQVTDIPDEVAQKVDFVVSESTHGSAEYSKNIQKERKNHINIIQDTYNRRGTIMYMSNSLERPEVLLKDLLKMKEEGLDIIDEFNIYLDTTFGINCLKKYKKLYGTDYLPENFKIIDKNSREQVMAEKGPKMIICTSPHFKHGSFLNYGARMLEDSNITLIFVAYVPEDVRNMAHLSCGSKIIFLGEEVILRCKRVLLSYYSSHAYTDELDKFFTKFKNIKAILFNHGAIESKINYVERYKTDSITTHNLLNGKAVLLSKNGIEKIL